MLFITSAQSILLGNFIKFNMGFMIRLYRHITNFTDIQQGISHVMNVELEILISSMYYIGAQFQVSFHVQEMNSQSPSQAQRIITL